tara:strand:- start:63998 stop:64651 length:654 start_codon:yes stop_codon:yes gene_type:complete
MKGRAITYSKDELAFIAARKLLPRRELHAAFVKAFDREDVSLTNFKALCKRKGWMTGRTGQFDKGHRPSNKGQRRPYNANSAKHQFKKGNVPPNTKYAGHERVSRDGYVEISIEETNPHTGFERRYVHKHRYLWEQANGPIPKGMVLKCLDGNKQNTDPSNWKLLSRALLPRLNGHHGRGYDDAPAELKPTILAVAELEHQARTATSKTQESEGGEK